MMYASRSRPTLGYTAAASQPTLAAIGLSLCFAALIGCSGSDGASNGSPGSCEPVAFSMLNVANSEAKVCNAAVQCMGDRCADTVRTCAGPDYPIGVYSGTCAAYFDCVKACQCDKTCADRCDPVTLDCASCLSSQLAMGCTLKCASEIASCGKR